MNTYPSCIHGCIRDWSINCTRTKSQHTAVQVQLAYSHENKKALVAKCASFIILCSWELSEGKDGKVEAPGREVGMRKVMRESSRPCLRKQQNCIYGGCLTGVISCTEVMPSVSNEMWIWYGLYNFSPISCASSLLTLLLQTQIY